MSALGYVETNRMVEEIIKKIYMGREMFENPSFYKLVMEQMQD